MVCRGLRLAVAWLLLLTLPVQGLAAAGMLRCMQHGLGAAQADAQGPCHEHLSDGAPLGRAAAGGGEDDSSSLGHRCAACALCCLAVALPSATPQWVGLGPALGDAAPVQRPHLAPALAGPERPPRS